MRPYTYTEKVRKGCGQRLLNEVPSDRNESTLTGAQLQCSLSRLPYPAHALSLTSGAMYRRVPVMPISLSTQMDEQCHQIVFTSMPCITGCDAVKEHLPVNDLFNLSCRLRIRLTCITRSAHVNTPAQCAVGASSATHPEVGDFQSPQSFAQQQIP